MELELVELLLEYQSTGSRPRDLRTMERLLERSRPIIERGLRGASAVVEKGMREIGAFSRDAWVKAMNGVVDARLFRKTLSKRDVAKIVDESYIVGRNAAEHWQKQTSNLFANLQAQMRQGATAGEDASGLIRRLRGKTTGRSKIYQLPNGSTRRLAVFDGGNVMRPAMLHATDLSRTASVDVANEVFGAQIFHNEDVIRGVWPVVTLDNRTSDTCISRSGAAWDLSTGDPLPESTRKEPYPGEPPWHFRCRTYLSILTRTWEEIASRVSPRRRRELERTLSPEVRRQLGSGIPPEKTYHQWLSEQPVAEQQDILGATRWKLWQDGNLTTAQLTDPSGRSLRVAELTQRRGLVEPVTAGG